MAGQAGEQRLIVARGVSRGFVWQMSDGKPTVTLWAIFYRASGATQVWWLPAKTGETFSGDAAVNSTQEIEWYLNPTWKSKPCRLPPG